MRVLTLLMRMCVVYMLRLGVCEGVRVCAFVCWNPTFQLFDFFALLAAAVRIMSVSHRPSSFQAL